MRRRYSAALFLSVLTCMGCQDSQAPLAPAAQVLVTPPPGTLVVGDTLQLQVRVLDAQGDTLRGRIVVWASSDPGVATVSTKGLVTVLSAGATEISAASEAVAGSITVTAVAPFLAVALTARGGHTCAIDTAGAAWCWGDNFQGGLGLGFTGGSVNLPAWQQAGPLLGIGLGEHHGCVIGQGGVLRCWGGNDHGEVGDSTLQNRLTPVPVVGGTGYSAFAAGYQSSCGLRTGAWVCWGGLGLAGTLSPNVMDPGSYTALDVGEYHSCALQANGAAFCLGSDFDGELGDSGTGFQPGPVAVLGGHHFTAIALGFRHSCGIDSLGGAWCWGSNTTGQLGDGTLQDRPAPVAVAGIPALKVMAGGAGHTCGLALDGTAWCWGYNVDGELGDGTTIDRLQPVPIGGTLRFSHLAAGWSHTCGIAVNSRVYCWGWNGQGALGNGSSASQSAVTTPTLVRLP
jgi:hypothetical protein